MRRIAKSAPKLECVEVSREEAKQRLAAKGQTYKVEAVDLIPAGEKITFYKHGDWEDLCEGPHVDSLGREFHFKLLTVAGAYWRGDEKRPQLQRIYGTAFWTAEELDKHLKWLEEVKQRDHRRLGTRSRPLQRARRGRRRVHLLAPEPRHRAARDRGASGGRST